MATYHQPILGGHATAPDTSGGVWWEPAAINFQVNDRYPNGVFVFADGSTRNTLGVGFRIPQNYVGTAKIGLVVAFTVTTGDSRLEFDYTAIANGESGDPSADAESVGATTTVPGTARLLQQIEISLTSGNFAAGDWVQGVIVRDLTDVADTVVSNLYLIDAYFSYSDA